ncbi:MAG: putative transcriptional regulator, AsnC family [Massilibacillus sp.]|nr:putative transcriptional regulator, AsnC family [Massilibacillus sp.]
MDELDKKIIRAMQDEFPLVAEPYQVLAQQIGITQEELIERLKRYKRSGQIRKMGAVLRHREVGYAANALCAWIVPESRLEEVATLMATSPSISHCYDRNTMPGWPYNVYTMIHGHSREECEAIANKIAEQNNLTEKTMLYSLKEWKKTSMRYFCE